MTTGALITLFVAVAIVMTAAGRWRNRKKGEQATTHGKDIRTEDLIQVNWRWPQWRKELSEALNHIHRHQVSNHHLVFDALNGLFKQQEKIMADAAEILAEARANTEALSSMAVVIDAINENETTIVDLIKKLKDDIGNNPILTELAAEVANQKQLIAGAKAAIGENLTPSGN